MSMVLPRIHANDTSEFRLRFVAAHKPVIVEGLQDSWSTELFTPESLAARGRGRCVQLELGNVMREETRLASTTLDEFIVRCFSGRASALEDGYLSVFDLLSYFPELRSEFRFPLFQGIKRFERVRAWIGPAGTLTGYHADRADNILAQMVGRKKVSLMDPRESASMYQSSKFDFMSRLSEIDESRISEYPKFERVRERELHVVLEPGESLFIPGDWWHRVESLDASISVNCFAWSKRELVGYSEEILKYVAHHWGFIGSKGGQNCVCHTAERPKGTGFRAKLPNAFRG